MRDEFRKLVIKEGKLFLIVLCFFLFCVMQNAWVNKYLEGKQSFVSREASLSQNLAIIGLNPEESKAILLIEKFKKDFPQFSDLSYSEAVGSYLAQYPNYKNNDTLYENVKRAQVKIKKAKGSLSKQGLLERFSSLLKKLALLILIIYPVFVAAKYIWLARSSSGGNRGAPIN